MSSPPSGLAGRQAPAPARTGLSHVAPKGRSEAQDEMSQVARLQEYWKASGKRGFGTMEGLSIWARLANCAPQGAGLGLWVQILRSSRLLVLNLRSGLTQDDVQRWTCR